MVATAHIPAWQLSDITALSNAGDLSGVNPAYVALIDQAESSGNGGQGTNPQGYGGFFGLSTSPYYNPAGQKFQVSDAQLASNSVQSFDYQAATAAALFASLLQKYGNPPMAEAAYQQGGNKPPSLTATTGPGMFIQAGATGNLSASEIAALSTPSSSLGSAGASASGGTGPTLSGAGSVFQDLNDLLNPSGGSIPTQILTLGGSDILATVKTIFVRGLFAVGFMMVTYAGVKTLSGSGGGSSSSVIQLVNETRRTSQAGDRVDLAQQRENRLSQPKPASPAPQSAPHQTTRANAYAQNVKINQQRADTASAREARMASKGKKAGLTADALKATEVAV